MAEIEPPPQKTWLSKWFGHSTSSHQCSIMLLLRYYYRMWTGKAKAQARDQARAYRIYIRNHYNNVFIGLPNEIILMIVDFLPLESRVLLSLSSNHLRAVITSYFNISLGQSSTQKAIFWTLVDRDFPDQMRCQKCLRRYRWRSWWLIRHSCPNHSAIYGDWTMCSAHGWSVTRDIINLILKAHNYGPKYGLPPSYADHECDQKRGAHKYAIRAHRRFEGRVIRGQFYYARSYRFVVDLAKCLQDRYASLQFYICVHMTREVWALIMDRARWDDSQQPLNSGTMQCRCCDTEFRFELSRNGPLLTVVIRIWQNHGHVWFHWPGWQVGWRTSDGQPDFNYSTPRNLEHHFNTSEP